VPGTLGQDLAFLDIVVLVAFVGCFRSAAAVEVDEKIAGCVETVEMHDYRWESYAGEIAELEKGATSDFVVHIHKIPLG